MRRRARNAAGAILGLAALAALLVAAGGPPGGGPPPGEDGRAGREDAGYAGAGLRVRLDPVTGELRSRPATVDEETAERTALRLDERYSTYGRDLVQERLAGNGFKVDLRGRFQSAVVATIDPVTDEVRIDCQPAAPVGEEAADGR